MWQLQLEPADDEIRSVATVLIQNLNDDGFHKEPPETLFEVLPSRLSEAVNLVRTLDPAGCCTSNYRESLEAQVILKLGAALGNTPVAKTGDIPFILKALNHLELFEKGKFTEVARELKCGAEEARACFDFIKTLSPFPGRQFTAAEVRFVVPDIKISKNDENNFVIIINNEVIPVLGINPFFSKLAPVKRSGKKDPSDIQAGEFARKNINEAKIFINSIAMRNHTLKLVARAIVAFQKPFFENGPQHLVPLTLGDIARQLDIHETTVSRTAHGKYMQTEWGIFELRYFFSNSIGGTGSGGSNFSKEGVKAIIQEMIGTGNNNLSDHEISELLASRGISLARRTVAKYRKELDLGSSYNR